jgi:glycosyltransferase involved in cell wall biosynthesis
MRWISEPDKGQSDAVNKGFAKSTGQILAWINSDDIYLPGAFRTAAEAFQQDPSAAIIYGDYIKIDADDRCVALRRQPSYNYRTCFYGYLTVMQSASFFQREAFFNVGGLDTSFDYALDYDLILGLAKQGKVVHIRKYLAAFRLHTSSKSVSRKLKFRAEDWRVRNKHRKRSYLPGELSVLFRFYQACAVMRMLREGCIPSRFGMDDGEYKLNKIYRPEISEFRHDE